jgi:hypothetical protein
VFTVSADRRHGYDDRTVVHPPNKRQYSGPAAPTVAKRFNAKHTPLGAGEQDDFQLSLTAAAPRGARVTEPPCSATLRCRQKRVLGNAYT